MNEATWIIILGLGLDIIGALLIIGPLRQRKYMIKRLMKTLQEIFEGIEKWKEGKTEMTTPETNRERIDRIAVSLSERQLEELKGYKKLSWGIAILILGFILQIIGNWIQNSPF